MGEIIKISLSRKIEDTIFVEIPVCTSNLNNSIFINRMNIFPIRHRFTVTIMAISDAIDNVTIAASSVVAISFNMTMTTPTIPSASIVASIICLLDYSTVRENIVTTTFLVFSVISTSRVDIIMCPLRRLCVSFSNRNVSEIIPMVIIEKFSILILKIPTNIFGIVIFIFRQTSSFEIILGFQFIGILMVIKNVLVENIT